MAATMRCDRKMSALSIADSLTQTATYCGLLSVFVIEYNAELQLEVRKTKMSFFPSKFTLILSTPDP